MYMKVKLIARPHTHTECNMCIPAEGVLIGGLGQIRTPTGGVLPRFLKLLSLP